VSAPSTTVAAAPAVDAPWPSPLRAWMVVGLLMVAYTSSFIDRQIMSLLVDPIRADLGISDTQFSLLAGLAFSIFYSVMGLPLGWVADRMSRRMLIIVGMIAWSVMTALCGLATSFLALFIARMGVGIGEAALSPAAYSLISDHFPPERRARAISAYAMGPYLGSGLALIIGGQVIEAASGLGAVTLPLVGELAPWQLVFLAVGLPGIPIALLFLLVREPVRRGLAPQGSDTELLPFIKARRTLFLLLFLGFSVFGIAGISYLVWIPAVFIRVHGWTAGDIGVAYGLILLCTSVPGVYIGGWVSDRLLTRGHVDAPVRVAVWVMLALVPLVFITPLLPDARWVIASLAVVSLLFGMLNGLPGTSLQSVVPNQLRGQIVAAYFLIGTMMSLGIGPTIVAFVSDTVLGGPAKIGVALAVVGAIATLASALMLQVSRARYRDAVAVARAWR
jgi:MFS family permease